MSEVEVTTETVEAPEVPASTEGGGTEPEHGEGAEGSKPAAYTPNFKFKVYDEEKEIPESFRALMKDSATEKEVRELFEKAYGLDGLKPVHQKAVKERDEFMGKFRETEGNLNSTVENLKKIHAYSQNDLDTFFQIYKIPQERLFQYVTEKLRETELPPEQVERLNAGRQAKLEADYYKEQVERQTRQQQEYFKSQHQASMDAELARPDVAQFAKEFDGRAGSPGSFLKHVNDYGSSVFNNEGRYVSASEAVGKTLQYFQAILKQNGSPAADGQGEAPPPPIPNVGSGRSVSPTKPKFKSLEQLRKHVKEISQEA